jgi:hypothetical protein
VGRYGRYGGWERARQHVSAARRLSAEVAGTDEDVKAYFFSLSPRQLDFILDQYGKKHGTSARAYAAQTIAKSR